MSELLPPTHEQMIAYLEDMVQQSRLDHQCSEATLSMAVARLGGEVEGVPTGRVNFLQRIDALRRIEEQRSELADALEELLAISDCTCRSEHLAHCPYFDAVEALRKTGRLL